jgi:hypothetical protein
MKSCIEMGGIDFDGRFWKWAQDTLASPIGLLIACIVNPTPARYLSHSPLVTFDSCELNLVAAITDAGNAFPGARTILAGLCCSRKLSPTQAYLFRGHRG